MLTAQETQASKSYYHMVDRCMNKKHPYYHKYGGKGIGICQEWLPKKYGGWGAKKFIEDMGPRPDGMTLDRIDNSKGYSKENCRWVSRSIQQYNRSSIGHSTKATGVSKEFNGYKNYFVANITKNYKYYRKRFLTLEEAIAWRAAKEKELYGEC